MDTDFSALPIGPHDAASDPALDFLLDTLTLDAPVRGERQAGASKLRMGRARGTRDWPWRAGIGQDEPVTWTYTQAPPLNA